MSLASLTSQLQDNQRSLDDIANEEAPLIAQREALKVSVLTATMKRDRVAVRLERTPLSNLS